MLRIRLLRVGKKNSPSFRLVVTPRRAAAKTGRFLEILGFYNPLQHTKDFKKERIQYWLSMGAQPSDTVHNLLVKEGMSEGAKIAVHKRAKAKEETPEEAPKTEAKSDVAAVESDSTEGAADSAEEQKDEATPEVAAVTPEAEAETTENEPEKTPEPEPVPTEEAQPDTAEEKAPKEESGEAQEPAPDKEEEPTKE